MNIIEPEHKKLNLGCGHKKKLDHWNVDKEKSCNPDQIIDLETLPWPFSDNFFEHIHADNILEHLGQSPKIFSSIIQEMYRVSADKATWFIKFPHHRSDLFFDDFQHIRPLTVKTFTMFDQKSNFECIAKKVSDSTYGLYYDVDLEVTKYDLNLTWLFKDKLDQGMIGSQELTIQLNTVCNVCESVDVFIKVHKPGRYSKWYNTMKK
jgi:hypothetical protein